jgi:hypothetical protein
MKGGFSSRDGSQHDLAKWMGEYVTADSVVPGSDPVGGRLWKAVEELCLWRESDSSSNPES